MTTEFITRHNGSIVVIRHVGLSGVGDNYVFTILFQEFNTYWQEQGEDLKALIARLEAALGL